MNSSRAMNPGMLAMLLLACATTLGGLGCNSAPGKPGPEPEVVRPEQIEDFQVLYGHNCAACHGEGGKNGAAIALNNPVYLAIAGTANIQRITSNGVAGTAMPPFSKAKGGMLTDRQIAILVSQMMQRWGSPGAVAGQTPAYLSTATGDPGHGQQAFGTFCARCHGADGTGMQMPEGVTTGSLVDPAYLALITDQGLRSFIVAGQTEQGAHDWRSYSTARPMTDQEITDVVAWLTSHRIAAPGQPYHER